MDSGEIAGRKPAKICIHLPESLNKIYLVCFTGNGAEYHWVCSECIAVMPLRPNSLVEPTPSILEEILYECIWEGTLGVPTFVTRPSRVHFSVRHATHDLDSEILDVQPDLSSPDHWFFLLNSGSVMRFDSRRESSEEVYRAHDLDFELGDTCALAMSRCGRFAAVYEHHGTQASIVDLGKNKVTATLSRGDYHTEHTTYPIVFVEHESMPRLIAASDWNKLEVLDPVTGSPLIAQHETDSVVFHGTLQVSPNGTYIADGGWAWHPVGRVDVWDLIQWLSSSPTEYFDGDSFRTLVTPEGFGGAPMCWIDDRRLAVWGFGNDDDYMLPAVRIFDVATGNELEWFPGPCVRRPINGVRTPVKRVPSMFFDRHLVAVSQDLGTTVWDIETGELIHQVHSLQPIHFHPVSREFLSLGHYADSILLSQLVVPGEEEIAPMP